MSDTYQLVRNAKVQVTKGYAGKNQPVANVIINDKYHHSFSPKSRVSKHLQLVEPKQLADNLSGGSFFFINDELVDFRNGQYKGFVHDDKTVAAFFDTIGFHRRSETQFKHSRKRNEDDVSDDPYVLKKVWNKNEIQVPGYQSGGDFYSQLSYGWNPFVKTVNSSFDLVRLICENGAVGLTSFLNTKIPVVNRWEEHLNIATRQIQNKVERIVVDRIQAMATEKSSVADLLLLEQHAKERWNASTDGDERRRLNNIIDIISPQDNLKDIYRFGVFEDKNLAAQLPGHLSAFDTYNVATEIRTHTNSTSKSSDFALDKLSNVLLFDRKSNYNAVGGMSNSKLSSFDSSELAFFGEVA